jgi:hypothetical protein
MRSKKTCLIVLFVFLCICHIQAQDKTNYKFGKVSAADFNLSASKQDSGANAVIISDIGSTSFEGNTKGFFTLVFTHYMRVKIMNKNGFDIGSHNILLYHNEEGEYEKISAIRGSTFYLENGVVVESKLDEKSIFSEKLNKNYDSRKFTLPALKEGAIFDLEYTIRSPFSFLLKSWSFQGEYPRLWSEYTVTIAPPFHYMMKLQGDTSFDINTTKEIYSSFYIREENGSQQSDVYNLTGSSLQHRWVKKNIPALHEEPFTTTLSNYNSRVSFQLNYFQWTNESERHNHMETWTATSKTLLEDENFGQALTRENNWMSDELKNAISGSSSDEEKTYRIFNYVRDNFSSVGKEGYSKEALYARNSLKDVFKKKEGNVAEINLLLVAMLRKSGIDSDPLILSTRDNGVANASYPLIGEYNYVIAVVYLNDKVLKLDASQPYNGFGQLPTELYNGWGHIINEAKPIPVNFSPDSLHESSFTSVLIFNDEKGKSSGAYKSVLGKSESYNLRREIGSTSKKNYEKKIQTLNESEIVMQNFEIDSLWKFDFPVTVQYDFDLKDNSSADILYFNPMIYDSYKTNPFKAMERHYPVEMPYLLDETYILNMDIPEGCQVDEMPKSARVNYNDNEGFFEYIIQKGQSNLQMRVHLKLNKTFFPTEEYTTLRDFFAFVVKKESEQIVFKKIK